MVLTVFARVTISVPISTRTTVKKIKSFDIPFAKPISVSQITRWINPSLYRILAIDTERIFGVMHHRIVIVRVILGRTLCGCTFVKVKPLARNNVLCDDPNVLVPVLS